MSRAKAAPFAWSLYRAVPQGPRLRVHLIVRSQKHRTGSAAGPEREGGQDKVPRGKDQNGRVEGHVLHGARDFPPISPQESHRCLWESIFLFLGNTLKDFGASFMMYAICFQKTRTHTDADMHRRDKCQMGQT